MARFTIANLPVVGVAVIIAQSRSKICRVTFQLSPRQTSRFESMSPGLSQLEKVQEQHCQGGINDEIENHSSCYQCNRDPRDTSSSVVRHETPDNRQSTLLNTQTRAHTTNNTVQKRTQEYKILYVRTVTSYSCDTLHTKGLLNGH